MLNGEFSLSLRGRNLERRVSGCNPRHAVANASVSIACSGNSLSHSVQAVAF